MKLTKKAIFYISAASSIILIITLLLRLMAGKLSIHGVINIKGYENLSIYLAVALLFLLLTSNKKSIKKESLIAFSLFLFTFLTLFQKDFYPVQITGDEVGYFSYLHSLYMDKDLNFNNEYIKLNAFKNKVAKVKVVRKKGKVSIKYKRSKRTKMVPNSFSIGPAILWMPFYALTDLFYKSNGRKRSGYEPVYLSVLRFSSVLYGFLGLLLLFLILKGLFNTTSALLTAFTLILASPLLYYFKELPFYSHLLSFFTVSLFLYVFFRIRDSLNPLHWGILGGISGIAALVRWQNAILSVLSAIYLFIIIITLRKEKGIREIWKTAVNILSFFILFFIFITPQLMAFKIIYEKYFTVPQGGKFISILPRYLLQVLFSPNHGLLNWHPFLIIGFLGFFLPLMAREEGVSTKVFFYLTLFAFVMQWIMNASITQYWAGSSFGARRFIGSLVFLAPGMANFINHVLKRKKIAILYVVLLNFFFAVNFFMVKVFGKIIPAEKPFSFINSLQSFYLNFLHVLTPKTLVFLSLYILIINTGFYLLIRNYSVLKRRP